MSVAAEIGNLRVARLLAAARHSMQYQPGSSGSLFLVCLPWRSEASAHVIHFSFYHCTLRTEFSAGNLVELPIHECSPFQAVCFSCQIEHVTEQNAFRGMRSDMRVSNSSQIPILSADNPDSGNLHALCALFLNHLREGFSRYRFDCPSVLAHLSLRFLPGQIHNLMVRLRRCWDLWVSKFDFSLYEDNRYIHRATQYYGNGSSCFCSEADADEIRVHSRTIQLALLRMCHLFGLHQSIKFFSR